MPSFNRTTPDLQFVKRCGLVIRFTHLSSGRHARFVGAITDFKDQFSSQWTEEAVYGRMDPISTFQRTGRKISLSWQILNENAFIGKQNMIEIQRLISFLYPNYYNQTNNASTISGGPLLKLKFSNFASTPTGEGLVGYLDGFTFDPDMESGYVSTIKDGMITTVINASVNFTVLHTHKLGWTGAKRRVRNFPYGISSPVDDNQDRQAQEAQDLAALNADVAALKATMEAGLQSARELSAAFKETEEAWKIAELTELANASNAAGQRQLTLDEKARIRSIASGNSYEHEYILAEHEQRMGEVDELLALAESETEDREANGELSNVRPTKKTPKWGPRKNGKTTPKGGGGNPPLSRGVKQTLEGLYAADDLRKIEAQKKKDQETDALISAAGDKCKYYKIMCDRYGRECNNQCR